MTLFTLTNAVFAASLEVSTSGSSLDEAVAAAEAGDTLLVLDGAWDSVTLARDLTVLAMSPSVSFSGLHITDGADVTVQGGQADRVQVSDATLSLIGVVFSPASGPAITAQDATVTVDQVTIRGRQGIVLNDSVLDAIGLAIDDAHGEDGGAIHAVESEVSLRGSVFTDTGAEGYGGAIYQDGGSLLVEDSDFGPSKAGRGGHIATSGGTLDIRRTQFANGEGADRGGSLYLEAADTWLAEVDFADNAAVDGGAISMQGGELVARDLTALNGQAERGAAIWGQGAQLDLTRTTFAEGRATYGGAIALERSTLWAENGFWVDSEWAEVGGALYLASGSAELRHILVAGNQAEVGAGIAVERGDLNLSGCIVYSNASEGVANAAGRIEARHSISFENGGGDIVGEVVGSLRSMDPLFMNPNGGDWALSTWSPAMDVGVDGLTDRDGTPADMGPFGGPSAWRLQDGDRDGHVYGRDCDDRNEDVFPGAYDIWYDGIDSDCGGEDDFDADRDGWTALEDCDETDPNVHPGAAEVSGDRLDADCDGLVDVDADGDGWTEYIDCDDNDPSAWPGSKVNDCNEPAEYGAEVASWDHDGDAHEGSSNRVQSTEFASEPPSMAVRTGCSSTGAHPTFLAALLALVGILLPRRRS